MTAAISLLIDVVNYRPTDAIKVPAEEIAAARAELSEMTAAIERLTQQLAPFVEECEKVGVPLDAPGLIRHHRGNAGLAAEIRNLTTIREQVAIIERVREVARQNERPFLDGVPDREGEAVAAAIRAALDGDPR